MQYIHVRNLEKYHPGYKDRELKWAKICFEMVQGDPDCEMITSEIDWARLIKFIILELKAQKPLPLNDWFLKKNNFDLKKRPMSLTLKMLHNFIDVVTEDSNSCVLELEEELEKELEEEEEGTFPKFVTDIHLLWNNFVKNYPKVSRIKEITPTRRNHLKKRYERESFRDFQSIIDAIKDQPFLLGDNNRNWCVDFDWVIANDNNYMKILERKYSNGSHNDKYAKFQV
jgi:hypothetical protein